MNEMAAVADLLARSDRSFIRTQHRNRTIRICLLALVVPIYAFTLWSGLTQFLATWREGDWLQFWAAALSAGPVGFSVVQVARWPDSRARLFGPLMHLREALHNGDTTLAPLASSPADMRSVVPTLEGNRIGPLRRPSSAGTIAWLLCGAVIALLVLFVAVPLALAGGLPQLAAIFSAICLPPAVLLLLLAWRYASLLYVQVDGEGLQWRSPAGSTRRLPWRDARSFLMLTHPKQQENGNDTLYVLAGENAALAWRTDIRAAPQDAQHSPSAALLQLIAERTGLPLRDVSVEAKRIAAAARPITVTDTAGKMRVEAARSPESPTDTPDHRLRMAGLVLSPFLLLVTVSLVAMLVQTPYYEHLYAQSHSHKPLYADPLTHADGDWPTTSFATFASGAYHFAESETAEAVMHVPVPRQSDSALYEVTGRTGSGFDLSGVGLAIAANDRTAPMLTFRVAPAGSWWLERASATVRYDLKSKTIRLEDSSSINKGFGSANRIAALVRGSSVIFFINSHYATGYQDDALAGGHVGLYLDPGSDSGDFNDFAIYPLG